MSRVVAHLPVKAIHDRIVAARQVHEDGRARLDLLWRRPEAKGAQDLVVGDEGIGAQEGRAKRLLAAQPGKEDLERAVVAPPGAARRIEERHAGDTPREDLRASEGFAVVQSDDPRGAPAAV